MDEHRRNSVVAGLVTGTAMLIMGYISGLGSVDPVSRLLADRSPAAPAAPATAATDAGPGATAGASPDGLNARSAVSAVRAVPAAGSTSSPAQPGSGPGATTAEPPPSTPASTPATTPTTTQDTTQTGQTVSPRCNQNIASQMMAPVVDHLDRAHLSEPPSQQVAQLLDVNTYVQSHLTLLEDVITPVEDLVQALPPSLVPLVSYARDVMSESISWQIAQVLDPNDYIHSQTTLAQAVAAPSLGVVDGSSDC